MIPKMPRTLSTNHLSYSSGARRRRLVPISEMSGSDVMTLNRAGSSSSTDPSSHALVFVWKTVRGAPWWVARCGCTAAAPLALRSCHLGAPKEAPARRGLLGMRSAQGQRGCGSDTHADVTDRRARPRQRRRTRLHRDCAVGAAPACTTALMGAKGFAAKCTFDKPLS